MSRRANGDPRIKLPYGTKVRINNPLNMYHGRIGYIEGDNWIRRLDPIIPTPFEYEIAVPTFDGQDIEHTGAEPRHIRVLRDQS